MHRLNMRRSFLVAAVAGLIGLVALVSGLMNTANSAKATTPDGSWKLTWDTTTALNGTYEFYLSVTWVDSRGQYQASCYYYCYGFTFLVPGTFTVLNGVNPSYITGTVRDNFGARIANATVKAQLTTCPAC